MARNQLDEIFMLECLALAKKGAGYVSPNPLVGAVLVKKNKVIARGYHKIFGRPHAEVNAIQSAKSSVRGATLYVNLEPCNYFGRTPPCTDLLIASKISRVVVGMEDPNPLVSGKGISYLRQAGISVTTGILEKECKKLNEAFTKYITTGLPFVTLKIAQTLDGKIAKSSEKSKWITNASSRRIVHGLRSQYDAVLVGAGTVLKDNPQLTVREVNGRNPVRVILDGKFRVNPNAVVFSPSSESKTILFVAEQFAVTQLGKKKKLVEKGVEIIELKGRKDGSIPLIKILEQVGSRGIASLLVEGGAFTFSFFLKERLADKLLLFLAPTIYGDGLDAFMSLSSKSLANAIKLTNISSHNVDGDILIEGYLQK